MIIECSRDSLCYSLTDITTFTHSLTDKLIHYSHYENTFFSSSFLFIFRGNTDIITKKETKKERNNNDKTSNDEFHFVYQNKNTIKHIKIQILFQRIFFNGSFRYE